MFCVTNVSTITTVGINYFSISWSDKTTFKENLEMEGLVLLAERKSPRYIQDKINSFVDVSEQFLIDRDLNNNTSNQTSSNA